MFPEYSIYLSFICHCSVGFGGKNVFICSRVWCLGISIRPMLRFEIIRTQICNYERFHASFKTSSLKDTDISVKISLIVKMNDRVRRCEIVGNVVNYLLYKKRTEFNHSRDYFRMNISFLINQSYKLLFLKESTHVIVVTLLGVLRLNKKILRVWIPSKVWTILDSRLSNIFTFLSLPPAANIFPSL